MERRSYENYADQGITTQVERQLRTHGILVATETIAGLFEIWKRFRHTNETLL